MTVPDATSGRALGTKEAYDALDGYGRRYGRLPLLLLLHVAVPQSFRADMLNLLKVNFLAREAGGDLTVDTDVLLSPLVEATSGGYYRMDPEVRRHALVLLDRAYAKDAERRSIQVARFVLAYADMLERQAALVIDPMLQEFLSLQRWVAASLIDPAKTSEAFAKVLQSSESDQPGSARVRLASITAALSVPLAGQQQLLAHARGRDALARGDNAEAQRAFGDWGRHAVTVGDVRLDVPTGVMPVTEGVEPATQMTLRLGSQGQLVAAWQRFLIQHGLLTAAADGVFGERTERATEQFQSSQSLIADGIVGGETLSSARRLGFLEVDDTRPRDGEALGVKKFRQESFSSPDSRWAPSLAPTKEGEQIVDTDPRVPGTADEAGPMPIPPDGWEPYGSDVGDQDVRAWGLQILQERSKFPMGTFVQTMLHGALYASLVHWSERATNQPPVRTTTLMVPVAVRPASPTPPTSSDQLGQILLRRKQITSRELRDALQRQAEAGGHLGAILKRMGACDSRSVAEALVEQVRLRGAKSEHTDSPPPGPDSPSRGLRTPWVPPPPPTVDGQAVIAPDPRIPPEGERSGPTDPLPPEGWVYFDNTKDVTPTQQAWAQEVLENGRRFPMGTFVQTRLQGALIAARVEWSAPRKKTGNRFRSVRLLQPLGESVVAPLPRREPVTLLSTRAKAALRRLVEPRFAKVALSVVGDASSAIQDVVPFLDYLSRVASRPAQVLQLQISPEMTEFPVQLAQHLMLHLGESDPPPAVLPNESSARHTHRLAKWVIDVLRKRDRLHLLVFDAEQFMMLRAPQLLRATENLLSSFVDSLSADDSPLRIVLLGRTAISSSVAANSGVRQLVLEPVVLADIRHYLETEASNLGTKIEPAVLQQLSQKAYERWRAEPNRQMLRDIAEQLAGVRARVSPSPE